MKVTPVGGDCMGQVGISAKVLELNIVELEEYFKNLEIYSKEKVSCPFVVRLDGVGFGKALKDYEQPRDPKVHMALVKTCYELMRFFNCDACYTTSDEISMFFLKYVPYGGRVEKIVSITASLASANLSLRLKRPLYFDSRIVKVDFHELEKYYLYRVRIGFNNYVCQLYHKVYKDKETPHLSQMIDELKEQGIDIGKKPSWALYGSLVHWTTVEKIGYNPTTGEQVVAERRVLMATDSLEEALKIMKELSRIET
ncbi:MAG: hypothetical protein DRN04_05625 [Thermoprotei archaeon]|nr:MAG: hypothetical protein DRN04_05625 [Thermoprotei archaeon]